MRSADVDVQPSNSKYDVSCSPTNFGGAVAANFSFARAWFHSKPLQIEVTTEEGGHGGGDKRLLDDVFKPNCESDPLQRVADHNAGALSILTGIAANQSFATGLPVKVAGLVRF